MSREDDQKWWASKNIWECGRYLFEGIVSVLCWRDWGKAHVRIKGCPTEIRKRYC